ncbi:MAG: alpha-galactosidase [Terriglobia bacterium]|nr:alpha-galactosidase [Terriglobia bacterium]
MNRRDFLRLSSSAAVGYSALPIPSRAVANIGDQLRCGGGRVVLQRPNEADRSNLNLVLNWQGESCRPTLTNFGRTAIPIQSVILCEILHEFPGNTALYGEGFQMLTQTAGTLSHPVDLGYNEVEHYRIPGPSDATVVTGLLTLLPPGGENFVLAFTSCFKFIGRFYLQRGKIQVVVETEGRSLQPNETWNLEVFLSIQGQDRNALLKRVADEIDRNHPSLCRRPVPTGWCSCYCFGDEVLTGKQITDNLDVIASKLPQLTYVQVDGGYQRWPGDWLCTVPSFGEDIGMVMKQIRDRGHEPGQWLTPFVAVPESNVFRQHPQWFIQDADGKPLQAKRVTFGGWGKPDWYALDGTHPEVQQHLENIFRYMREEWDCKYFKLDANFWGAMHGGYFHDPAATRIEAYRRGMEAIRRGAGNDSYLLGCNHPIWPSFGLIDGSRSSDDMSPTWDTVSKDAWQTLHRNWQNGRLWWNDPDAVILQGKLTKDEVYFHATAAYAAGGVILAGDDLTKIQPSFLAIVRKLLPPSGVAAVFDDNSMQVGRIQLADARMVCVFNREDHDKTISIRLFNRCRITDYWSDMDLGEHEEAYVISGMSPHSARLLRCE